MTNTGKSVLLASSDLPDIYEDEKAKRAVKDPGYAYLYALNILKARWDGPYKDMAERSIAKYSGYAYLYAKDVLKARWDGPYKDLAEERILGNQQSYGEYLRFLREHDTSGYVNLMWALREKGLIEAEVTKMACRTGKKLYFSSVKCALQRLSNLTGKRVVVGKKDD